MTLDKKTLENNLDKISFTFVDLVKYEEQRPRDISKLNLEEKFYYFLRHAEETSPEELKKLIGGDKVLEQSYSELNHVYWTESELQQYESDEKAQMDNKAAMDYAKEKAYQEGHQEGRQEERYSVAKNLLKFGAPIELVKKSTILTEEQIESLNQEYS